MEMNLWTFLAISVIASAYFGSKCYKCKEKCCKDCNCKK